MFFKNLICLLIGLIIGVRMTDFWDYVNLQQLYGSISNIGNRSGKTIATTDTTQTIENSLSAATAASAASAAAYNNTRVLCWIMTAPKNHEKARHILNTWGRRCNKLIFMSTQPDEYLRTVTLPVREGRAHLWNKTREAFKYVYDHHFNDADWFLKADDDTYFIMDNLRAFLYQFSSEAPVYFGCKFHPFVRQGYMSGGAGYVLSKEALRRFVTIGYPNATLCTRNTLSEDKEMGICMQKIGVVAGDSRDDEGRDRFLPLAPHHLFPSDASQWFGPYSFYKHKNKSGQVSPSAVSFHYIKPKDFYILDYFIYKLRVFGVRRASEVMPMKVNTTELIEKWRYELSDNLSKD